MTNHRIQQIFDETGWVLADGATGTNLFAAGLETGYPPELWNVERPEDVAALHNSFIDAGAQLILTNSFGGTAHRLRLHGAEARVAELNEAAARIARKAGDIGRDRHGHDNVVAGSIGPTGELFAPMVRWITATAATTSSRLFGVARIVRCRHVLPGNTQCGISGFLIKRTAGH